MSNLGRGPRVTVEAPAAYELVLSLSVAAEGAPTAVSSKLHDAAGGELLRRVRSISTSSWMWAHLLSVAYEAPAPRDLPAFRAFLERMPAVELQRRLVGYYVRWFRRATSSEVMDAAIGGDREAKRAFLRTSYPEDRRWQEALATRLESGPAQAKRELIRVVDAWEERVFAPVVEPTLAQLASAAAALRRSLRTGGTSALSAAIGWHYVPEPGISSVLVVPSLVIRPQEHEFEHEQIKIFCVPVEPASRALADQAAEILAVSRALADETRLRMVLTLAEGDLPAQELADRTGAGLTTVLHHLAHLREAGLVTGGGRRRPYRLEGVRLLRLAELVARAGSDPASEGSRRSTDQVRT